MELKKHTNKFSRMLKASTHSKLGFFVGIIMFYFIIYIIYRSAIEEALFEETMSSQWEPGFFDLSEFQYSIHQKSCAALGIKPGALIFVYSEPDMFNKRQAIRNTWGNKDVLKKYGSVRILFAIGSTPDNETHASVLLENQNYRDIVQGSFLDAYGNKTYKSFMMFRWYKDYCPEASILITVSHNTFLNTPALLRSFKTDFWEVIEGTDPLGRFIMCDVLKGDHVVRTVGHLYYVPPEEYELDKYPYYCADHVIFYSKAAALELYETGTRMHYVRISDAFTTGIVRNKTEMILTYIDPIYAPHLFAELERDPSFVDKHSFVGPIRNYNDDDLLAFWKLTVASMNRNHEL
jgi:hypothetical protein